MPHSTSDPGHGVLSGLVVDKWQQTVHQQAGASKKEHGGHAPSGEEVREPVHVHVVEVTHEQSAEGGHLVLRVERDLQ